MEIGERIYIKTEGNQKIGTVDRSTAEESAARDKFIILLTEGETLEDGEHFMSEFEPATGPTLATISGRLPANYLKLNKGNGY